MSPPLSTARTKWWCLPIEKRTAGDYDLLAEALRFAKLAGIRENLRSFPVITFRRTQSRKRFTSGHCRYGNPARITVTIGTDPHGAVETMLHEIVHAALGYRQGHSTLFWSTLRSAAKLAWPDATFDFVNVRNGWHTDRAIVAGITAAAQEEV